MTTPTRDELIAAYLPDDRTTPRVRINFVSSADGAVTLGGRSGSLGGETDRRVMQVLRMVCDVIVVGAGTVRAEGYGGMRLADEDRAWREAHGMPPEPRFAIVSAGLHLEPTDPVFAQALQRPLVVTCAHAPSDRRARIAEVADVLLCGETSVDLAEMRAQLAARDMPQILSEGGPHLFGSLLDAGLVDELCLTLSPRVVGGDAGRISRGAAEADRRYRLRHALPDDEGFVFLRYAR